MKEEIKLRYVLENIFGDISFYYLTLEEIENGTVQKILNGGMKANGYKIVAKNLFIGREDRNGKLIYVGDVVGYYCKFNKQDILYEVRYGNIKSVVGCENINLVGFYLYRNREAESFTPWLFENLTVYGNNFENEELLK